MNRQRAFTASAICLALLVSACSDDSAEPAPETTPVPGDDMVVVAGEPFPEARCEANRAAGTISYLTGFDFAAAASILEVVVAENKGYYEDLCLDVTLTAGGSVANYPLVAANDAQFSSSGSFSELASFSAANQADLVTMSVDGHVAIDVLMAKPDRIASLSDIAGSTIGIKFALPPAIAVMLLQEEGLAEGTDYETLLLDGFDPTAHWAIDELDALPGWRSNEPGALERAGIAFDVYDPADYGIPGSFGLIYTNREFLDAHPTAAEDFMRATMQGLADAIADPAGAAQIAVDKINGGGNPAFLSPEGETFRWVTDAATIVETTPDGAMIGQPIPAELEAQVTAYAAAGVYGDTPPSVEGRYDADLVAGLYDTAGKVIWPS
jgi:NitT/TauT family transport system substrate-binding protein